MTQLALDAVAARLEMLERTVGGDPAAVAQWVATFDAVPPHEPETRSRTRRNRLAQTLDDAHFCTVKAHVAKLAFFGPL